MTEVTYFVALPFVAADDGIAAGEPTECFNPVVVVKRWISTARKHRLHSTRSSSRGISLRRLCWTGSHGLPAARGSRRIAFGHRRSNAATLCSWTVVQPPLRRRAIPLGFEVPNASATLQYVGHHGCAPVSSVEEDQGGRPMRRAATFGGARLNPILP